MKRIPNAISARGLDPYAVLGLTTMAVIVVLLLGVYSGFIRTVLGGSKTEVTAMFANSGTVRTGDPVRIKGVTVGSVTKTESAEGGRATKATMRIDTSAGRIHSDARAHAVWRSLLGGAFAVNLEPGRSDAVLGRRSIPVESTTAQVELDDITTVIQGKARAGLKSLPTDLGDALADPQALEDVGTELADNAPSVQDGLNAARGQNKDRDLAELIDKTATTVTALDAPDDELRKLVAGTASVLQTTAVRQGELRRLFQQAPSTLRDVDTTLDRLETTFDVADPVLDELQGTADEVAPTLRKLNPVVTDARRLLVKATPLVLDLRPAASQLASAARDGVPLLDDLQPSLDRLDETILPYFNKIDPETDHTTAQMVGPGLSGLAQVAAYYDQNGHALRFPATTGSSPVYLPCQIYANNPDKKGKFLECQSAQELFDSVLTYSPLAPAPGTNNPTKKRSGK